MPGAEFREQHPITRGRQQDPAGCRAAGGSARESNPPAPLAGRRTGFEDRDHPPAGPQRPAASRALPGRSRSLPRTRARSRRLSPPAPGGSGTDSPPRRRDLAGSRPSRLAGGGRGPSGVGAVNAGRRARGRLARVRRTSRRAACCGRRAVGPGEARRRRQGRRRDEHGTPERLRAAGSVPHMTAGGGDNRRHPQRADLPLLRRILRAAVRTAPWASTAPPSRRLPRPLEACKNGTPVEEWSIRRYNKDADRSL